MEFYWLREKNEKSICTVVMGRGKVANFASRVFLILCIITLVWQYSQCKDKIKSLEKLFTDPNEENRTRTLRGKDPPQSELFLKIEEVITQEYLVINAN